MSENVVYLTAQALLQRETMRSDLERMRFKRKMNLAFLPSDALALDAMDSIGMSAESEAQWADALDRNIAERPHQARIAELRAAPVDGKRLSRDDG